MAIPKLILRTRAGNGVLEPESVYHILSPLTNTAQRVAAATAIANIQAEFIHESHEISEWRYVDGTGIEVDDGPLAIPGSRTSPAVSFYYCLYIELISAGPKSPSSKYIHGFTEGMANGEVLDAGMGAHMIDLKNTLIAQAVTDSDGFSVTDVKFGHFSRRSKVRKRQV